MGASIEIYQRLKVSKDDKVRVNGKIIESVDYIAVYEGHFKDCKAIDILIDNSDVEYSITVEDKKVLSELKNQTSLDFIDIDSTYIFELSL